MGHYERYVQGLSGAIKNADKWRQLCHHPSFLERARARKENMTEAHVFLAWLRALEEGYAKRPKTVDALELEMRGMLFSMTRNLVKESGKPSMVHLMTSKEVGMIQAHMMQKSQAAGTQIHQGFRYAYFVHQFQEEGFRTYRVSPGLSDKLAHTVLKGLRCSDVRLPYPTLYIEAPKSPKFRIWNDTTGWHDFEGVYLSEDPYYMDIPEDMQGLTEDYDRVEACRKEGRSLHLLFTAGNNREGAHQMDDALVNFTVLMPKDEPLDQCAIAAAEKFSITHDKTPWGDIFQWAVNVMIYSTWSDCEREHIWVDPEAKRLWKRMQKAKGKKAKRIGKQLNERNQRRIIYLGGSIKVDRSREGGGAGEGTRQPLLIRQRIAGHWKHQPHGPNRSLRRLQWIDPYWRGPEDGPIKQAVHELRSKEVESPPAAV